MVCRHLLLVSFLAVSGAMHLALISVVSPGSRLAIGRGNRVLEAKFVPVVPGKGRVATADVSGRKSAGSDSVRTDADHAPRSDVVPNASDGTISLPLLENYLPPSLLTTLPSPIDSIDPTPPAFRVEGVIGEIELMLLISSDGDVDDVLLIQSSLPMPFVDYASDVFRKARFTPATVNLRQVRSRVRIVLGPAGGSAATEASASSSMKSR